MGVFATIRSRPASMSKVGVWIYFALSRASCASLRSAWANRTDTSRSVSGSLGHKLSPARRVRE